MTRSSVTSKDTSDHLRLEDCTEDYDHRDLVQEMLTWNGDHLRLEDCTEDDDHRDLVQETLTWNGDHLTPPVSITALTTPLPGLGPRKDLFLA